MRAVVCGAMLVVGVSIGFGLSTWWTVPVAAQAAWQCRSWTLGEGQDAALVGTWLGGASTAQIATAGLSAGSRSFVLACKR